MSIVKDVFESVTGIGANKAADKAAGAAKDLSKQQSRLLALQEPLLRELAKYAMPGAGMLGQEMEESFNRARQFDPAAETERAMMAYDAAAREGLDRDMGSVTASNTMRGFTRGNASSDQAGEYKDVLSRRAADRGSYMANLRLRETDRRDEVTGRAFDRGFKAFSGLDPTGRLNSAAGALQGPANTQMDLASHYGNVASNASGGPLIVQGVSNALKGLKLPPMGRREKRETGVLEWNTGGGPTWG